MNLCDMLGQSSGAVCESRGGRPGFPVPNSPYGLCGRKATLNSNSDTRSCVKVEVDVLGTIPVPNSPYGLCGRKAPLNPSRCKSWGTEHLALLRVEVQCAEHLSDAGLRDVIAT